MQKIFLPLLFVTAFITRAKAQQRFFDQAVQLKTCNISIEANSFIATTVIEMEFYNPRDQEVEARQNFELNRGQVITDFQLELDGKYREGIIEERWKAVRAYSDIVGKRIDPAILQMTWQNQYSINIYPVAAKSSRKIKFTITQMMLEEKLKLSYLLPLKFNSTTADFKLDIKVNRPVSIPYANAGLLKEHLFDMKNEAASLLWQAKDIILDKPISFSINQFANEPQYCFSKQNGKTGFLMRFYPDMPRYYLNKPKAINVYWDVSLSGKERNLSKELDFLETYISVNEISKTSIFLFNHEMQGIIVFERAKHKFSSIRNYLLSYKYSGATELGNLDFSNVLADAVLLFSDGINSLGNAQPKPGAVQVNVVTSNYNSYYEYYNYYYRYYKYTDPFKNIIGNTGGSVIYLYRGDVKDAVKKVDTAENFLFKYNANNIRINETFPIKLGGSVLLSGTFEKADNLELFYGNNTATVRSENYFLPANAGCDGSTYKKMQMLKAYDSLMYNGRPWQDMIIFGLTERVITPQTSFLVLERIEDYIKYKIAPPKELEEKCAELNYVYRSEYKIEALKEFTEQEALEAVVKDYNKRIDWWSKGETLIDLNKPVSNQQHIDVAAGPGTDKKETVSAGSTENISSFNFKGGPSELKEVVVTSAFGIKRTARSTASNVQNLSGDQVNTIRQVNVNNALAGKVAGTQVRSQSVAKLGAESIVRLRGENGFGVGGGALYVVDGTIMPSGADINPDDVEDYSVLQGPAAAALFGPDGSNGAIVITLKKGKRGYNRQYYTWSEYKWSSAPDEDYVQTMKEAADYELWDTFFELEKENQMDVGFYFEMANFFFGKGKTDKAQELMYNAIELSRGSSVGLRLSAYLYENWKWFDKAIAVYKSILSSDTNNLVVKRDLALAYFQAGNFETAVKTYYSIITANTQNQYGSNVKENVLAEMNAVIALHKNEFDISYINQNLVKILPVDLRITIESNYSTTGKHEIIEPGNIVCNSKNPKTKNGGRYTGASDYNYNTSYGFSEYAVKNAVKGRYRIKINAYNNYSNASTVPMYIRVVTFKNFQKENMKLEIKLFDLDNQYGVVELDEVKW